jgi:hypothetical protein
MVFSKQVVRPQTTRHSFCSATLSDEQATRGPEDEQLVGAGTIAGTHVVFTSSRPDTSMSRQLRARRSAGQTTAGGAPLVRASAPHGVPDENPPKASWARPLIPEELS